MKVTVYSTRHCGYCRRAEDLLRRHAVDFEVVDVTGNQAERHALIERARGRRTVPVIFIGDELIGGYQELAALAASGRLTPQVPSG